MTHQEKIQVIREACIAANPSITELKFGCKIDVSSCSDGCCGFEKGWIIDSSMEVKNKKINHIILKDTFTIQEILGRNIRLVDVLLVMGAKENWENIINGKNSWNLLNDSLDAQSESTISFLYQLIKEK